METCIHKYIKYDALVKFVKDNNKTVGYTFKPSLICEKCGHIPSEIEERNQSSEDIHVMLLEGVEVRNNWIVNIKGNALKSPFEISVVREDNAHGIMSYGWFDKSKLLISSSGGPCKLSLKQIVWDKMIVLANEVARELNEEEME